MLVLALDTSTPVTTVALLDEERLLASNQQPSTSHSKTLLPCIDTMLQELRIDRHRIQAVAVGIGPGSFTGVRIGLAVAKTLTFAMGVPLVGVSSLRALMENGKGQTADCLCAAIDALKGEVFCSLGRMQGTLVTLQPESAQAPLILAQQIQQTHGTCLLMGTGAERYRQVFIDQLGEQAQFPVDSSLHQVRAESIGRLGLLQLRQGKADDPRLLEPLYCRLSEAELGVKHGIKSRLAKKP